MSAILSLSQCIKIVAQDPVLPSVSGSFACLGHGPNIVFLIGFITGTQHGYRQTSNIRRTQSQHLNVSNLVL